MDEKTTQFKPLTQAQDALLKSSGSSIEILVDQRIKIRFAQTTDAAMIINIDLYFLNTQVVVAQAYRMKQGMDFSERKSHRQEHAKPLLDLIKEEIFKINAPPKPLLGVCGDLCKKSMAISH